MIFKYTRLWLQADPARTYSVLVPTEEIKEGDSSLFIEEEVGRVVADSFQQAQVLLTYAISQGRYPADSQLSDCSDILQLN
jgi:hypothetical protein